MNFQVVQFLLIFLAFNNICLLTGVCGGYELVFVVMRRAARVLLATVLMFMLGAGMGAGFGLKHGAEVVIPAPTASAHIPISTASVLQPAVEQQPVVSDVLALKQVLQAVPSPEAQVLPAWKRFAVSVPAFSGPSIAVVLDDVGVHVPNGYQAADLPGPLTLALMTYARNVEALAERALANGHELLVHIPMEPFDSSWDTGPNALRTDLSTAELDRRIEWALSRFEGAVGINNHMGSRFTSDNEAMASLMEELSVRGMLFLDSLTSGNSQGRATARSAGVPFLARDVFLDNEADPDSVWARITEVEMLALRRGTAIAVAHPKGATLQVLRAWLPTLAERGITLVPLSAMVDREGVSVAVLAP